jgi:hypothetical protein
VVFFHLLRAKGSHGNRLPHRQLGDRIGNSRGRAKVDVELRLLGSFQNDVRAGQRPASRRLTRAGLDLDDLSGKRNDFRPDRLTRDTARVADAFLGESR